MPTAAEEKTAGRIMKIQPAEADSDMPPARFLEPETGTLAASDDPKASAPSPPSAAWSDIVAFLDNPEPAMAAAFSSLPTSDLLRLSAGTLSAISARLAWYDGSTAPALPPVIPTPPPSVGGRTGPPVKEPPAKGASQAAGPIPQQKACPLPHPKLNAPPAAPVRANPLADVASGSSRTRSCRVGRTARPTQSASGHLPVGRCHSASATAAQLFSLELQGGLADPREHSDNRRSVAQAELAAFSGSVLSASGYCTHICTRLATNSQGNRCLGEPSVRLRFRSASDAVSARLLGCLWSRPAPLFSSIRNRGRASGSPLPSAAQPGRRSRKRRQRQKSATAAEPGRERSPLQDAEGAIPRWSQKERARRAGGPQREQMKPSSQADKRRGREGGTADVSKTAAAENTSLKSRSNCKYRQT
ncbi:CPK20 [Symbiodinium sp. CCMP2592]|nr:CPK20 [Symbiodinium sp. CCMP2592]